LQKLHFIDYHQLSVALFLLRIAPIQFLKCVFKHLKTLVLSFNCYRRAYTSTSTVRYTLRFNPPFGKAP
ncbi:MAG: hypothetical protein ABI921_09115, partial [Panacibacter sp.]